MTNINLKFLQAQNGDCFLVSFTDKENNPRNILIDGGRESAYFDNSGNKAGELKAEIDQIRSKGQVIDLLVLSHIDNDHICGLLKWFELDKHAHEIIKNVWFNSGKLIAEYLSEPENPDLNLGLKIFDTTATGVNEAIDFEKYLLKHKIWERCIVLKGQNVNVFDVEITVLSPDKAQLTKLLKEYKSVTGDIAYTSGKEKDWNISLKEFIIEERDPKYTFKQDTSVKNGSSISFILSIDDIKFLFLGDSHPIGISNALKELGFTAENPLEVAAFKISHHGSKSNTSKELISQVKTNNYLLSSDSTGHNHPNKRVLARIIDNDPEATLHFNYEFVKKNILQEQDFIDFPKMKIKLTSELDF